MVFVEVKHINNSSVSSGASTLQLIHKYKNPQICRNAGLVWSNGINSRLFFIMMERPELLRGGWAVPKACVPSIGQQRLGRIYFVFICLIYFPELKKKKLALTSHDLTYSVSTSNTLGGFVFFLLKTCVESPVYLHAGVKRLFNPARIKAGSV